jgi:hypothetical protein
MAGSLVKPAWTFRLAQDQPEVSSEKAVTAGARTVGTGRPGPAGEALAGVGRPP